MKIKFKKHFPVKGFLCITWFGTIYVREDKKKIWNSEWFKCDKENTINHESIHEAQALDFCKKYPNLGYCVFYLLYGLEYLIRLGIKLFYWKSTPYKALFAEVEAYTNSTNFKYLRTRKRFSQYKLSNFKLKAS